MRFLILTLSLFSATGALAKPMDLWNTVSFDGNIVIDTSAIEGLDLQYHEACITFTGFYTESGSELTRNGLKSYSQERFGKVAASFCKRLSSEGNRTYAAYIDESESFWLLNAIDDTRIIITGFSVKLTNDHSDWKGGPGFFGAQERVEIQDQGKDAEDRWVAGDHQYVLNGFGGSQMDGSAIMMVTPDFQLVAKKRVPPPTPVTPGTPATTVSAE